MITQYRYRLRSDGGAPLPCHCAYRLYSGLLARLPEEYGSALHQCRSTPVSQFLYIQRETGECVWVVNLLNREAEAYFTPVLTPTLCLELPRERVTGKLQVCLRFEDARDFLGRVPKNSLNLTFPVPTAFKQAGHYVALPQEKLLLQSMQSKWNEAFPETPITRELGLTLDSFLLHSSCFRLKGRPIPGFCGSLTLSAPRGDQQELEALAAFARFGGIGIKTALGMGGVL